METYSSSVTCRPQDAPYEYARVCLKRTIETCEFYERVIRVPAGIQAHDAARKIDFDFLAQESELEPYAVVKRSPTKLEITSVAPADAVDYKGEL